MPSLVFVHGIGVRAAAEGEHPYDATCRAIRYELFLKNINFELVKCQWGDDLGARLLGNGKSFPPERAGALGERQEPSDLAGLWEILLDDPTFELRVLNTVPDKSAGTGSPTKGQPQWVQLQAKLAAGLQPKNELKKKLVELDLETIFQTAVKQVQGDPATRAVIRHSQASRAIARSIVARCVRVALETGVPSPTLADLEILTAETDKALQDGKLSGVGDWAKTVLLGWGTDIAERRRLALCHAATPIAGDVILYQAHGGRIRSRIAEAIAGAKEPVVVLAHSLGGVATVETLCENEAIRNRVKTLITAGSQSGFFYEIDALRTLPFGTDLPADFPDWLNFWDHRDFLSFVVEPVFTGGGRRRDVQIDSGLPFPASHSGYWRQRDTWDALKNFIGT